MTPSVILDLTWRGDLCFDGRAGETSFVLDGRQRTGPSPLHALAAGPAGCMTVDALEILTKARLPLRGLPSIWHSPRPGLDLRASFQLEPAG